MKLNEKFIGWVSSFLLHSIVFGGFFYGSSYNRGIRNEENIVPNLTISSESEIKLEFARIPTYLFIYRLNYEDGKDYVIPEPVVEYLNLDMINGNLSEIKSLLNEAEKSALNTPYEKKLVDLEDLLLESEKYSKKNVEDITDRLDKETGVKERAYESIEGLKGDVDYDSTIPYEYKGPFVDKNGKKYYELVLIDKDGRTLKITKFESEMTSSDYISMKMLNQAKENPNLRKILNSVYGIIDGRVK